MKKLFCLVLVLACAIACCTSAFASTKDAFMAQYDEVMTLSGLTYTQSAPETLSDSLSCITISSSDMSDIMLVYDNSGNVSSLQATTVFNPTDSTSSYNVGVQLGTSLGMIMTTYRIMACGGLNEEFQNTYTVIETDATNLMNPVMTMQESDIPLDVSVAMTDGTGDVHIYNTDKAGYYGITLVFTPNF